MLEQFKKQHPIFAEADFDGTLFEMWKSGVKYGKGEVYKTLDRKTLETMLEELDYQEEQQQNRELGEGRA